MLWPYRIKGDKARFLNVPLLFWSFVIFVAFPVAVGTWCNTSYAAANAATAARVATEQHNNLVATAVGTLIGQYATEQIGQNTPTGASTPAEQTTTGGGLSTVEAVPSSSPEQMVTPFASAAESLVLPRLTFKLSFYDPNIGAVFPDIAWVNCSDWDPYAQDCAGRVNLGRDHYSLWYRRGVACPAPFVTGQRLHIISPPELRRINPEWTCIDRGGAIVDGYLDFMLDYPYDIWTGVDLNNFPWNSPVIVEVLP